MDIALRHLLLTAALVLPACGGVVSSGATPDPTPTPVPPTTPPGDRCLETNDSVTLSLLDPKGVSHGCIGGEIGSVHLVGSVTAVDSSTIEIDTCPPWADCAPSTHRLDASAVGLDLRRIPVGAFVEVDFTSQHPWGCVDQVLIKAKAEWGTMKNPAGSGERLYFAATNGAMAVVSGTPFTLDRVPLGCMATTTPSCGPVPADDYALRFSSPGAKESPTVSMGATVPWTIQGQALEIRNLQSIETGSCDDGFRYGWYVIAK
jgi:hypothetical protein